jgi:hypothetical protein
MAAAACQNSLTTGRTTKWLPLEPITFKGSMNVGGSVTEAKNLLSDDKTGDRASLCLAVVTSMPGLTQLV